MQMRTNTRPAATLPGQAARRSLLATLATYLARRLRDTRNPDTAAEFASLADLLARAQAAETTAANLAAAGIAENARTRYTLRAHRVARAARTSTTPDARRMYDVGAAEMEHLASLLAEEPADAAPSDEPDWRARALQAENLLRGVKLMARQWSVYPLDGFDDGPEAAGFGAAGRAILDLIDAEDTSEAR